MNPDELIPRDFEDLHWIDSETPAMPDGLVESLPPARLLLLLAALARH